MSVVGSRPKQRPCSSNCTTCDHSKERVDGWCYMFETAPEGRCYQHTGKKGPLTNLESLAKQAQQMSANNKEGGRG